MIDKNFFGLDFGTSNTAISMKNDNQQNVSMINLEGTSNILPSCIFYSFTDFSNPISYGEEASELFIDEEFGRYFRSLKSMLGSSIIDDKFMIKHDVLSFRDVLEQFLKHVKYTAEEQSGTDINNIVVGRPVFFVDNDPERDKLAEEQLLESLSNTGFNNISFQYEPIAAALNFEMSLDSEQLVMVVDIGGGTSDFSIIKIGGTNKFKHDRSEDILSNTGVHVGGTNLDADFSMHSVMPLLGSQSLIKPNNMRIHQTPFKELATWHNIHLLNEKKRINHLRTLTSSVCEKDNYRRFMKVLEKKLGYFIAYEVEQAKIALTQSNDYCIDLGFIENCLDVDVTNGDFKTAIEESLSNIQQSMENCLQTANVKPNDISTILFTGGTTNIPAVRLLATSMMPNATQISNDIFSSVSKGLSIDCYRKFQ
tara:strand:+ start:6868 stop:8139 length:1272 start_codon:yes stop_codon:yes gene_type:complete